MADDAPVAQAKLVIPSRIEHLSRIRELIENSAAQAGFSPQRVQRIVTAAFEAVVNAATHGSPLGPNNVITVVVRVFEDRLEIEVFDQGDGFPDLKLRDMPDTTSSRGRGIALMRTLMDKVELDNGSGARVKLTSFREKPY